LFVQILLQKEVITMREENQELVVLEEGVNSGVVQTCCTSGSGKL